MSFRGAWWRTAAMVAVLAGMAGSAEAGLVLPNYRAGSVYATPDLSMTNGLQFSWDGTTLTVTNAFDINGDNSTSFQCSTGCSSDPFGFPLDQANSRFTATFTPGGPVPQGAPVSGTGSFSISTDGTLANTTSGGISSMFLEDNTLQFLFGPISNGISGLTFGEEAVFWATTSTPLNLGGTFSNQQDGGAVADTFSVPEPGMLSLLALGLIGFARRKYQRR